MFSNIRIELENAMGEIGAHPLHPRQSVADRAREGRLAGDAGELLGEPGFKLIERRGCLGLAERRPALGGEPRASFSTA